MGKTRKVSKGHSSHFVPDYRHAVETRSDLERVGSMGRVDTEMTASEGSCAPKRRCVSLNGENYDASGVPVHVFPVSQMSHSEKIDLECRLRNELQHVRFLQRRLASLGSTALVSPASGVPSSDDRITRILHRRMGSMESDALPSPDNDIHSLGAGIRRPALENLDRHINEGNMPKGKKKPPQARNGPRPKVSGARRPEPAKPGLPSSTTITMLMKQCETLLQRLMSQNVAYIFNEPVDIVKANVPDYFTIIKHPMDLGTIKSKLLAGQYLDPLGFAADVRLTFSNAMTYNPQGNEVHDMAKTLSKFFEVRWKLIEKKFSMMVDSILPSKPISNIESETDTSKPPIKKKKVGTVEPEVKQNFVKRVMTLEEKQRLTAELEEVASELPDSIIDFLKGNTNNSSDLNDGELEIDLDSLTDETLFTLRDLLSNYLSNKPKGEGNVEPCEMELNNESMFSNSSVPPCRGNNLADEDVDIGGNDVPISSFPPLEIENDGAGQNNKHSSSSSSSSDSGSSSSDSDTGSASHGDSDGIKNKTQVNEKETCNFGESLERKSCIGAAAAGAGDIVNGDVQPNSEHNVDGCQDGGRNAPTERQVSPGKNYRAALLRSRFADTILKAQEKALEKDEKMDLDRLRLEREEFERTKKEDKARLLADARAAEVAHRKVEAEAAAKAKRKRELEREAARQALQKMEKTVDINENTQFLEALEILRSAPEQSLLGMTSPDDDLNGLGSFNLQASSNPLEQLGLYMKDDNEEEEGDHHITSQMDKTFNINDNTQSLVDGELLISTPKQSLLGVTSPDDIQNGILSYNLQASSNSLEQLGLYKKDDNEEEEGEHHISSQMETTTNNNQNSQPLEDLEILRSAPEQSLIEVTSPEEDQNGLGSYNLQASGNSVEQLGLHKKDDVEEAKREHQISSQLETTVNITENTQSLEDLEIHRSPPEQIFLEDNQNGLGSYNLHASSNSLEQLGLHKKDDGEEEEKGEHQISSQMETSVNINENTSSLEDLKVLGSAQEQSLLGATSPEDDQNGLGSCNPQASSNSLEQLGLHKKDDEEEETGEHQISSQMETTVNINENTSSLEDLEVLGSAPEQSLLGATSLEDDQNSLRSCNPQASSNSLEQLGLRKKVDKEEEEGEHQISSQMETTVNINENARSLEDLEVLGSAPEQSLIGATSPKDDQNGLGNYNLQASNNSLEQLSLHKKDDEVVEEKGEHQTSSQMGTTVNINENTQSLEDLEVLGSDPEQSLLRVTSPEDDQNGLGSCNLEASSHSLDQLGIHKKDEVQEIGEHQISLQMETTVDNNENTQSLEGLEILGSAPEQNLSGVTSPEDNQNGRGSYTLEDSSNSLEQLGVHKKDDDEETPTNINQNTLSPKDLEMLTSAQEQSLLGVSSSGDRQNDQVSCNLQVSSPSEQQGLYKDGEEEEESEHHISSQMETTVNISENTHPPEDLEILGSAPETSSLGATSPEDNRNCVASYSLPASSNSLEQLGLYEKDDDDEEGEPRISSQLDTAVIINENTQSLEDLELLRSAPEQSLLQASSNPLEQLGLYMNNDDEEEGEP